MHNVILPQQQRAAEAAAQTPLPPPPHPMEAMREQAEAQARKGWGALAVAPGLEQVGIASDHRSQRAAESAALRDCAGKGGNGCLVVIAANNQCIALALNADRLYAVGSAQNQVDASRIALADCNVRSPDKICNLYGGPVCSGIAGGWYGADGLSDEQQARTLEASTDQREFWGAMAGNGDAVYSSAHALTQAAAERAANEKCGRPGCKLLAAHKNSCIAVAWGSRGAAAPFVAQSLYPENARIDALSRCSAVHAQSCTVSAPSCSGRTYFDYDYARIHPGASMADNERSRQPGSGLLEPWVDRPESEFRGSWGLPSESLEIMEGESRLQYVKDYTTTAGVKRTCTAYIFTRESRIISYLTEGDACGDILR
ncbi:MAG TPA: DUF4189 domain-containing protein [Lysobacter sp.]